MGALQSSVLRVTKDNTTTIVLNNTLSSKMERTKDGTLTQKPIEKDRIHTQT